MKPDVFKMLHKTDITKQIQKFLKYIFRIGS